MRFRQQRYVLGFAFTSRFVLDAKVLLVKKQHPEWQRGYYNGVGGKLDYREIPVCGMVREFREEVFGFSTLPSQWEHTVTLRGPIHDRAGGSYLMYVFRTFLDDRNALRLYEIVEKKTENADGEMLHLAPVYDVRSYDEKYRGRTGFIDNLEFIVPMQFFPLDTRRPTLVSFA